MKARHTSILFVITSVLSTFVICLCASVSKIIPFFFVTALVALSLVLSCPRHREFTVIKEYTQKTE